MAKFSDSTNSYIDFISSLISKCHYKDQIECCVSNIKYFHENNTKTKSRDEARALLMMKVRDRLKYINQKKT